MTGYYAEKLSGRRLQRCYDIAPARVKQYLEAEIEHAINRLQPGGVVVEFGCGYGRVTRRLVSATRYAVGIDTARASLELARAAAFESCEYALMDALNTGFRDGVFDAVVCLQNGISAFGVDQRALLVEALRVTRAGGLLLFSTYADRFWHDRVAWFEAQAAEGLVGAVDHEASRDGVIVCSDGFRAGRLTPGELSALCARVGVTAEIAEVDGSSVFCEIAKGGDP